MEKGKYVLGDENIMNIFEQIKKKYKLETNIKGIEYIDAMEKEVQFLQSINLIATHLMTDNQFQRLKELTKNKLS
jgi:hypothetical protein